MATEAGLSLFDPETFSEGGFLDNQDVTIVEARVVTQADTPFDPQEEDSAFLKITMRPDGAEDDAELAKEYYRLGGIDKFTPSADKKRMVAQPGATVAKKGKAGMFFASLLNAGFPKKDLPTDNNVTFLEGLHVHVNRVEMKGDFNFADNTEKFNKKGKARDPNQKPKCLVVTQLLEPLGTNTGKAAKPAPKPAAGGAKPSTASSASPAAAMSGDVVEQTENTLVRGIIENGAMQKRLLPTHVLKTIVDKATSTAAFKLIGDNNWLADDARPWTFDAGSGELTPSETTAERFATLG